MPLFPSWTPRPMAFESLDHRLVLSAVVPHDDGAIEVALIDRTLPNSRDLIAAALGTTRVVPFDGQHESASDVLHRVAALAEHDGRPVKSLSIFSHGTVGQFALGDEWVSADNVADHEAEWKDVREVLGTNATVQVYGCNTADGVSGRKLLERLSEYTGAVVFGSTNISGEGGDWNLETESTAGRHAASDESVPGQHLPLQPDKAAAYHGALIWTGATTGSTYDAAHDYNNTANWASGTIDDSFAGVTLTGSMTLYLASNRTTVAAGLNLGYGGNFDLTFKSNDTTAHTLTLAGPISGDFGGTNDRVVTIGNATNPTNVAAAATRTVTITDSGDNLSFVNVMSGAGGLSKAGVGTLTLAGANTYTGGTTVSAGTLLANNSSGSATGTGAISVASTGTLGGTGAMSGAVSVASGGTINPGSGATTAILHTGSLAVPAGGTSTFTVNTNTAGSGYDQISVTGTVNITGSTLGGTGARPAAAGNTIIFIDNDGADAVVGTFAGLAQNTVFVSGSTTFRISYTGGDGNDVVLIDITPTPATAVDDTAVTPVSTPGTINVTANDTDPNGDTITVRDVTNPAHGTATASGGSVTYTPTAAYRGSDTFKYLATDSNDGIAHYWKLDGDAVDSVGASSGTLFNSPATVTGYYGSGESFDKVNDYISIPDFTYSTGFTASFRFKVDTNAGTAYQFFYSHGTLSTANSLNIRLGQASNATTGDQNKILTDFRDSTDLADSTTLSTSIASLIGDGAWHQYTLVVTSGGGSVVYIDGAQTGTSTNGGAAFDPTGSLYLGSRSDLNASNLYGGKLDSVAVYASTLSASQASDLYTGGTQLATVNMTVNALPSITSNGGGATGAITQPDAGTAVTTVTATDADTPSQTLSYSISGGADAAKFAIDSTTGVLTFITAPSFDSPTDAGANNVYDVTVQVSDSVGGTDTQALAVTLYKKVVLGFQAEHYNTGSSTGAGFTTDSEAGALNGQAIETAGDNTAAVGPPAERVGYTVHFPDAGATNSYKLYVRYRLLTDSANDDSAWAISSLDGDPAGAGWDQLNNLANQYSGTGYMWIDLTDTAVAGVDKVAAYNNVAAGLHSFYFGGRENGFLADAFVFSTVPDLDLTGAGQAELDAAVDERPVVATTGSSRSYTENAGAITVDNAVTVTDSDSTTLAGAIVQITGGYQSAEDVLAYAGGGGITGSWNSATGTLTLSGTATLAAYQTALRAVTYANTSENPNTGTRTVSFTADDGTLSSAAATRTITVTAVNDAPTTTAGSPGLAYTENQAASVIDATVTVADVDNSNLAGATVRIATNFSSSEDVLAFTNQNGITGSYDSATGILTLTGTASVANYQTALRTITYANTSENPSTLTRQVTFTVTDGTATSTASQVPITVARVNDAPTVGTPAGATPSPVTGTTTALSALGADDTGESGLTYTWAATTKPAGSSPSFSANGTNAAKASTVTFDKAGSYSFTVTISDGSLTTTSVIAVTVNQTLTSITVSPSSASLNFNGTQQFAATGKDQFGVAMASQPTFTWSKASGIGSIDASGLYTAPAAAGSATVQATSGAVSGTASVTVTNASPTIATPAAATPSPVTGTTTALSVLGADDGGESNLTYTWSATTKPAGSAPSFSANGSNAAKASTVTFDKAGSYTFNVALSDGTNTTNTTVSVTVSQTLTSVTVSPSTASLNLTGTQTFTAIAYDQFAIAMSSQPLFTWSKQSGVGSINSSTGVYSAGSTAGSAVVVATSGAVSGSANVTVTDAAPTVATPAAGTPSTVTGMTTALTVLGADDNGEANLTYTWVATTKPAGSAPAFSANGTNAAKASTVTFDKAGSYAFTVTISDGTSSVTSVANVTVNQTLTTITVSPGTASLNYNATQAFSAVAYDQFGAAMTAQPTFVWSRSSGVGSINSSTGVYTAGSAAGTAIIAAVSGGVNGNANITVTNATPTVATAAAATPSPVTGTTTALSVLGADDGGESNLTYTWSTTAKPAGSAPTFNANGSNAAKASTVTFDKAGSYTFKVTISDGALTVTSTVVVTVSQTFSSAAVTPASVSLTETATQTFSATGYDQFGVAMASQPTFTWSKTAGIGSIDATTGLYAAPGAAGTATVQAASGAVTATASVTVSNAAPTVATPAAATPSPVAGTTTALSALGADDNGETNLTYTWAATTKPAGSAPSFSANGTNAAKASTVTFDKAGSYTFTVTISDGQAGTVTSAVTVTVSQTLTSVTVSPSSTSLNLNGTQAFTASGFDQFGIAMSSPPTFTWSKTAGIGSIDATTGLYTAPASTGTATIQATSGGISNTATITVSNAAPTVATPAGASPSTVTATTTALSVLGADDNGESNLTYTWAVTTKPAGSAPIFSANATNAAKASTVTFDQAGSYTFTVTISDGTNSVTSAVNVTVSQTLASITVSPGSSTLNLNGTQTFTAAGFDQFGDAMSSPPTFTWSKTSGVGTINTSTGVYTAASTAGSAVVAATSGGVSGSASITVTNAAPTVATVAAATPAPATGTTTALSALGADDNGESNLTYTWVATTKPAGSAPTFSANGTNAAKASTVTFDRAGSYTFTVTISDGSNSVTSAVSMTVNQTLATITVSPSTASLNLNQTQQFTAVGYDQFGVAMSSQPSFTWSKASGVGSINASGLYTAGATAGSATVQATSGAVNGTATITVANAAPTVATSAAATPSPVTGTTTALSVLGADDNGESNLTYTWVATTKPAGSAPSFSANATNAAKASTVTFDKAGSYTFTVTISDGTSSVTSSVSVTVNQTLASIVVSPGSTTATLNQARLFTAAGFDQFGAAMAVAPTFTWSVTTGVGSIDGTGSYTSATAGSATVRASNGVVGGTATITVTDAAPTVATPAAATPAAITGTTTALSVLGADDGGESNLTYTWTVTAKPGGATNPTFSFNGTNASKATTATFSAIGSYTFAATISDGTSTVTSSVSVTVTQTATTIVVTPANPSMGIGDTQQFGAIAYDQFDNAMTTQPTFSWSVSSGTGSVDAAGLYTAAASSGPSVVTASAGGVDGSTNLTVVNNAEIGINPNPVSGTTANLFVAGPTNASFTYTWSVTAKPAGASDPIFSDSGTNAAKTITATFDKAGSYTVEMVISDGGSSSTTTATFVVTQTLTSVQVTPATGAISLNQTHQLTATGYDQFGDALASQPTFTWAVTSGVGSVSGSGLYTAANSAGTSTVRATSAGISGTATIGVGNAAPTVGTAAAATPSPVTGTTTALSVLGADDGGESALTYTWAATSSPTGAVVSFSDNGSNAAKSSTVTFDRAGSYTFTVTITDMFGVTTTSSASVTVQQTLTSIIVSPASASLNLNGTQTFAASGYDQFDAAMSSPPTFTWDVSAGGGSIDASGVYTAAATAGSATVRATNGAVHGTASVTITDAPPTIATPAAATPTPVTGTTTTLSALGADDAGEASLTYTWSATTKPSGSTPSFAANGTNAAKSSVVTFDRAGSYIFTVTVSDGTSSVTSNVSVTVNQSLTSITVSPAGAGSDLNETQQFAAIGYDQFSLAMVSQPTFAWNVTAGVGSIDAAGLYTAGATAGSATIEASSAGVSGTATFTVTNAAPTVATAAAASPATVTATSTALTVLGADDAGEGNLTYTWAATTKPAGSTPTFSANGTNGAKSSAATFDLAGSYTFTVTISDGTNTVTSTVNVTVDQTLASVAVSPGMASLNLQQTQAFSAVGYDQFGDALVTQPPFTWTLDSGVGSIDTAGVYHSGGTAGTATVRAASSGIGATAAVTVTNATPTVATPASASPATVTGTTTDLSVRGADDAGEPSLTYTWVATTKPAGATPAFSVNGSHAARDATVTFDRAGSYTFTVTISDGNSSVTSSVNVDVNQTLTSIAVSPTSPSVNLNGTQAFSATGYDQFAIAMTSQPTFTWSKVSGVGSINASAGLFTAATTAGSATVQAASGGVSGSATITVNDAAPTVATPAAASPTTATGTTSALTVLGADDGGESGLTYTWVATSKPTGSAPSFDANGTNGAKASTVTFDKAGSYTFTVTISDGTSSVTSAVSVTVTQTLSSVGVTPATATVHLDQTQQLAATGYDQFGIAMAVQPAMTWSVDGGGAGSIDASGLYSSGFGTGSATARATSGGISGTAVITVVDAAPTIATAAAASPSPVAGTTTDLSVLGADDAGESNLTYTWTASAKPAGANPTFSANGTNAAKLSSVTFDLAGSYTFLVTVSDGTSTTTSSVVVTVSQTLTSLTLTPGFDHLVLNATRTFAAAGFDQFGDAMVVAPSVTWSIDSGGVGSIDSSGVYNSGAAVGTATIRATSGGVSGSASMNVTDAAPTVAVSASATPLTATTTTLSARGADDGGESNLTYTWTATATPSGSNPTFDRNGTNAARDAVVTFDTIGSYTFVVTISDGTSDVTSTVSVTVTQTASSIVVSPASASTNRNGTVALAAVVYDQFGTAMATQPALTWSVASGGGSVSSAGLYQAGSAAGSAQVEARTGAVVGSATITVANASPTVATPASASPSPVSGTSSTLSVLGADDGGESGLAYAWSITSKPVGATPAFATNGGNAAKSSVVTFDRAGSYTFLVTISDGIASTTSSVVVNVQQSLTTITAAAATTNLNGTRQLSAVAYDQFGIAMASQPSFTWSKTAGVGTVNGAGFFTAGATTGSATVQAASGLIAGTATITVIDQGPSIATPATIASASLDGTTVNLAVLGADDGGESKLTYTWSVRSMPAGASPTFGLNGVNGAKQTSVLFDRAGTYRLTVTISDGTSATTSEVTAVVAQKLTTLVVTPDAGVAVDAGQTRQFSVAGFDQFGAPMTVMPTTTWQTTGAQNQISSAGLFTAGATAGTFTVTATSGSVAGSARVTTNAAVIDVPQDVQSQEIAQGSIEVTWTDTGGDGFIVERSTDGNSWTTAATLPAGETTFVDAGLAPQTTYFYRLLAVQGGATSDASLVVQTHTQAPQPPPLPPTPAPTPTPTPDGGGGGGVVNPGGGGSGGGGLPTDSGGSSGSGGTSGGGSIGGGGSGGAGGGGSAGGGSNSGGSSGGSGGGSGSNGGGSNNGPGPGPANNNSGESGKPSAAPAPSAKASDAAAAAAASGSNAAPAPAASGGQAASGEGSQNKQMTAGIGGAGGGAASGLMIPQSIEAAKAGARAYEKMAERAEVKAATEEVAAKVAKAEQQQKTVVKAAASVTATAMAGYVLWLVQGGALAFSIVSAMPFWKGFDMLPVLDSWEKKKGLRLKKKKPGTGHDSESDDEDDDSDDEERELDGIIE